MRKKINIIEEVGKPSAVLHTDGLKLYDSIIRNFDDNQGLIISFNNIKYCTTSFLNASIGKFLEDKQNTEVLKKLTFMDLPSDGFINDKLNVVIKNVFDKHSGLIYDQTVREEFYS